MTELLDGQRTLWTKAGDRGEEIKEYVSEHPGTAAVAVAAAVGAAVGVYFLVSWLKTRR